MEKAPTGIKGGVEETSVEYKTLNVKNSHLIYCIQFIEIYHWFLRLYSPIS
jgi:hypothetical protein